MNEIKVRHMRHSDQSYSMTIEREMTEERRPMTDMCAARHSTSVTFYDLTPDGMLELANEIMRQAFKIKDREEQDATTKGEYAARTH